MPTDVLPGELREFLESHVDSVAQLEALLLLQNGPDVKWDPQSIAKRLYTEEKEALSTLTHLAEVGLILWCQNVYKFEPRTTELRQRVSLLAQYYRTHLIPITNLVHTRPQRIQQFADAFKLRKE